MFDVPHLVPAFQGEPFVGCDIAKERMGKFKIRQAKYDGDNRTDIALFRPSDGKWYVLRSSDGSVQAMHFGLNGDVPTIAR